MICPICKVHMKTTNKVASDKQPFEIRKYKCPEGHIYVSQEELLDEDELENIRKKSSEKF